MSRLVVTGANGFVGRHLTRAASDEGWDVVGVVRSEAAASIVGQAGGRPALVPGLQAHQLAAAFRGGAAVVHLAQIGAERGGARYEGTNVQGTREVLQAAGEAGVARLVFLSGLGVAHYGTRRRCTNGYFLSKQAAERELLRSGLEAVIFRPSYILGPGGELVPGLLEEMGTGEVERVGDGRQQLQPVAIRDVSALILAAVRRAAPQPLVLDLVGPEALSYQQLVERVARVALQEGRQYTFRCREVPAAEAERQAAAGGYKGMLPDELDCLLCSEVSTHRPLQALLGRPLTPLDEALRQTVGAALSRRHT